MGEIGPAPVEFRVEVATYGALVSQPTLEQSCNTDPCSLTA